MKTEVLSVDPKAPDVSALRHAAAVLERGGLVAFPTETVYGLGALALNSNAVQAIFHAKGRPATNPVIIHISGIRAARELAAPFPRLAEVLSARFWPGPLTLVVPRACGIPDIVTAGGPTVALRAPAHPVAQALLTLLDKPLAAPSANRSTEISPTTAAHVLASLQGRIDLVLDGDPCSIGIESTVVDATATWPLVLRPGSISRWEIEQTVQHASGRGSARRQGDSWGFAPSAIASAERIPLRSPGLLARHYAPRAQLEVVKPERLASLYTHYVTLEKRVRIIGHTRDWPNAIRLPDTAQAYASALYSVLHTVDEDADIILVECPPDEEAWEAIRDRLKRASYKGFG